MPLVRLSPFHFPVCLPFCPARREWRLGFSFPETFYQPVRDAAR
jgi:hypothetical protein